MLQNPGIAIAEICRIFLDPSCYGTDDNYWSCNAHVLSRKCANDHGRLAGKT